jgi:hypothetical protein
VYLVVENGTLETAGIILDEVSAIDDCLRATEPYGEGNHNLRKTDGGLAAHDDPPPAGRKRQRKHIIHLVVLDPRADCKVVLVN